MARVARLTPRFRRSLPSFGIVPGSARWRALMSTIRGLSRADALPGHADFLTEFHPGHAQVRRVAGHNLWVLYRFDTIHLEVLAVRDTPPVPVDE